MTPDPMPEPDGPEDERFVYVVTTAGVEALRQGAAVFDSEGETRETPAAEQCLTPPARRSRAPARSSVKTSTGS